MGKIFTDGKIIKHGVDLLRECWICFGKDTRKRAYGCFFTTSPRLETKRKPVFCHFKGEARATRRAICGANERWVFHKPVEAVRRSNEWRVRRELLGAAVMFRAACPAQDSSQRLTKHSWLQLRDKIFLIVLNQSP